MPRAQRSLSSTCYIFSGKLDPHSCSGGSLGAAESASFRLIMTAPVTSGQGPWGFTHLAIVDSGVCCPGRQKCVSGWRCQTQLCSGTSHQVLVRSQRGQGRRGADRALRSGEQGRGAVNQPVQRQAGEKTALQRKRQPGSKGLDSKTASELCCHKGEGRRRTANRGAN